MHSSWFSYPVSRAYPFRWFTPVTVAGGLVLTVLFTLVNLASSGFYLKPIFTDDPNGTTTAEPQWFMKAPFNWESNLDTQCQAKMLSVGDRFFTTNLGFQYTVKAISVTDDSENPKPLPSVPYLNNTLQDCFLSEVVLKLRKTDTAPSGTFWLSWTASTNDATASCLITTDLGTVNLTLGVEYEAINSRQYPYILQDNHTTHATTWWGTRLLNPYWAGVWEAMSKTQLDDDTYWSYGSVTYFRNQSISDIRSIDFLGVVAWFLASDGNISNPSGIRLPFLKENPDHFSNSVIYEGRHYAKILHSLVAADLGNCDSPSLLRDEDGLQYAILAPDDPNRDPGGPLNNSETGGDPNRYTKIPRPGTVGDSDTLPLNESYAEFRPLTGDLTCSDSTIVANYLCSVPQSKSTGTMLLAIVLANLVFLQAAWKILGWIAQLMLPGADPQSMVCEGCLKGRYQEVEMEGLPDGQPSPQPSPQAPASREDSLVRLIP